MISLCDGTACHVKGSIPIYDAICGHLKIPEDDDTDPEGIFTVQKVACLGCCTLAPAVQIDDVTYGHLTRESVPKVLNDFLKHAQATHRRPRARRRIKAPRGELRVGLGSCCVARGSGRLNDALERALVETGIRVCLFN